jgi:hypothetical protein
MHTIPSSARQPGLRQGTSARGKLNRRPDDQSERRARAVRFEAYRFVEVTATMIAKSKFMYEL